MSNQDVSDKLIDIRTVQTNAFKNLFESLKEILIDINIIFTPEYMKVVTMDSRTQTILVHLKLYANKFEYYYCKEKTVIGLNLGNFFRIIRTITNNDTLSLYINTDEQNLIGIKIENSEKNMISRYFINLIEVDETEIKIGPPKFQSVITMPSNDFNKICRDMINIADTIEIKSFGSQVSFSCKGDFATQETIMGQTTNGLYFEENSEREQVIQGYYNLKHLVNFAKCTSIVHL